MATIVTRAGKGSELTHNEVDANFNNLNADKQETSNKDATGGYAGLTALKLNLKNAANTFTNFLTNTTTAARTWTMQDRDYTVAGVDDITGGTRAGSFTTLGASGLITATGGQIKFPAIQAPSADPNTFDDYEEGTWTPNQGIGVTVVGTFSSSGGYIKKGGEVTISGQISGSTSVSVSTSGAICSNAPFAAGTISLGTSMNSTITASQGIYISSSSVFIVEAVAATPIVYFSLTYSV